MLEGLALNHESGQVSQENKNRKEKNMLEFIEYPKCQLVKAKRIRST